MDSLTPNHSGLSRGNIMESVYASLERLQTDHIDLLYFHAFAPLTPAEESLLAIEDLVKQDLVRYFAVSNFSIEQLESYKLPGISARSKILAVQNQFNILDGESEKHKGAMEYAVNAGISYIAWSPMARGLLTDRYLEPGSADPGDRLFDEGEIGSKVTDAKIHKLRQLGSIARETDLEISQLVIAYMLSLPAMGSVIRHPQM